MKQLFNFANVPIWPIQGFETAEKLASFLVETGMDGVETFVYDNSIDNSAYVKYTTGVHLKYWPCWLPLFEQNEAELKKLFDSQEKLRDYYRASNYDEWLEEIKKNIRAAAKLEPEYVVWHVADCTLPEAFSFNFKRSNKEVLKATAELYHQFASEIPTGTKILFENLWWPGLNLVDPGETEYFLEQLNAPNVGFMLDTGHLINMSNAPNEAAAIEFLLKTLGNLGSLREYIYGMHLNLSLSAEYRNSCKGKVVTDFSDAVIGEHIRNIDQHRAFSSPELRRVVELVEPQYINHELYFYGAKDLKELLQTQLKACRG